MKTRKFPALALALVLCLGLLPTVASANEYDDQHSYYKSFYLPEKTSSETVTFEVPTTGLVDIYIGNNHRGAVPPPYYCVFSEGDRVILEKELGSVSEGSSAQLHYQLEAGIYTIKVSYASTPWFQFTWPDLTAYVRWNFRCGHQGDMVEGERKEATCTEQGYQEYICAICNAEVSAKKETFKRLPHTPDGEWQVTREATCEQTGYQVQLCTVCGEEAEREYIDILPHDYGPWTVEQEANCLHVGKQVRTCQACGDQETKVINNDADRAHDYGPWKVITEATATSTGKQRRTCSVCGYVETATIPKLEKPSRPSPDPAPPTPTPTPAPVTGTAYPSTQTVNVDGKAVQFAMYALKDQAGNPTNYIRVRDLAALLNGTAAQFEVGWNGKVTLATKTPYTGSTDKAPFSTEMSYTVYTEPTYVNGIPVTLDAIQITYNGGGYTYYQLRDLGENLGFNVGWSAEKGIFIETDKLYDPNN